MSHTIELLHGNRLKAGDTEPTFRAQLIEDGYPFDLDSFGIPDGNSQDVRLKLRRSDSDTTTVDVGMTVVDANRGLVKYSWTNGDTDTSGTYLVEIIADNGQTTISWPSVGFDRLYITDGL